MAKKKSIDYILGMITGASLILELLDGKLMIFKSV